MVSRIGGLGGLGGFSFPSRTETPSAGVVQTDEELLNSFNLWRAQKEGAIPDAKNSIESIANRSYNDYLKAYSPFAGQPGLPQRSRDDFLDLATRYRTGEGLQGFNGQGEGNTNWVSGLFATQDAQDASRAAGLSSELAAGQNAFQSQIADRASNVTRQSQAYGNMIGNGQVGGVMGADYTKPNFGQVTGQAEAQPGQETGGFNAWGMANPTAPAIGTAPDMGWTNGAYGGGAGKFTPAPWGGLIPGKWGI